MHQVRTFGPTNLDWVGVGSFVLTVFSNLKEEKMFEEKYFYARMWSARAMTQISAYLHFNGNCREAMTFYKECLGGELTLTTIGESPMAAQMPDMKDKIMHSVLAKDGFVLMASDMMGPEGVTKGDAISLSITGTSATELRTFFSKLSRDGKVNHELKEEFFGTYGDLTDKFGIDWMFQADAAKA
jgi:PhnB protein